MRRLPAPFVTRIVAAACALVVAGTPLPALAQSPRPAGLHIVVLEGEDAVNIVQQRTAVAPVVEVRDRNDQPIAGAVVKFAIKRGKAAFNGAKSLTVTTNASGRAVAEGLVPGANGPLQITASASVQGQTATITITQTNVATAAEASSAGAAGGAGGAGATSTGAAAAGGAAAGGAAAGVAAGGAAAGAGAAAAGGGISAVTLGVIGGAVGGGAFAAKKIVDKVSGGSGDIYSGSFAGQFDQVIGLARPCTNTETQAGTLELKVEEKNGAVSGLGRLRATWATVASTCGAPAGPYVSNAEISDKLAVSGSASNLTFNWSNTNGGDPNGTTVVDSYQFSGSLSGSTITGTLVFTKVLRSPNGNGTGTVSMPVTLTKQ